MNPQAVEPQIVPLTQVARGRRATVSDAMDDHEDAQVLRAMGLRPNAELMVCRLGEPCIVALANQCGLGCRIGLSRRLAECVMVSPCG